MSDEVTKAAVTAAKIDALNAQAASHQANARKANAEARNHEIVVEAAEMELERERYRRQVELAQNEYHRTYYFNGEVDSSSVGKAIDTLSRWTRLDGDEKKPYTFILNSPGGSVVPGLALYDFLVSKVRAKHGHPLRTEALGMAASMGAVLLQAGDTRVMSPQASLLIHKGSLATAGSAAEVEDTVEWVRSLQKRLLTIIADRAEASGAPKALTRDEIEQRWERRDWWMTADQALEWGLVDEVGT